MCKIWNLWFFLNEIFETTIRSDSVLQSCKQDERRMMSSLQRPRKAQSNPQVSKLVVLIFEAGGEASHASCPALFQVRVAVKRQRPAAGRLSKEGRIRRGGGLHCRWPTRLLSHLSKLSPCPLSMMPFCFSLSASPFQQQSEFRGPEEYFLVFRIGAKKR